MNDHAAWSKRRMIFFGGFTLVQIILVILLGTITTFPSAHPGSSSDHKLLVDIMTLALIGFGLISSGRKGDGIQSMAYALAASGVSLQSAVIAESHWGSNADQGRISTVVLIRSTLRVTTTLCSYGAVSGIGSGPQILAMSLCESLFASLNAFLIHEYLHMPHWDKVVSVHVFLSAFSLPVFLALAHPLDPCVHLRNRVDYHHHHHYQQQRNQQDQQDHVIVTLLGVMVAITFFPSYSIALAPGQALNRLVVNTVLSMMSCVVVSVCVNALVNAGRWRMAHLRSALIAGGVGMAGILGSLCGPSGAAGFGACIGFCLQLMVLFLEKKTAGSRYIEYNATILTHGLASITSTIVSVCMTAYFSDDRRIYGSTMSELGIPSSSRIFASLGLSIALGIASGSVIALILTRFNAIFIPRTSLDAFFTRVRATKGTSRMNE